MNPNSIQNKVVNFIYNQEERCMINLKKGTYTIKKVPLHTNHTNKQYYTFEELKAYYSDYSSNQVEEMFINNHYPSILVGLYEGAERVATESDYEDVDIRIIANIFLEDMEKIINKG